MPQTDLKSDNFCGYNTAAASMYWILDPIQNRIQYNIGEVGVPTGVGLNTPGEVIQVDSFLKDIGNYLTSCNPPAPPMPSKLGFSSDASINKTGNSLPVQGSGNPSFPQNSPALNNENSLIFNNEKVLETFPTEKEKFANNYFNNKIDLTHNLYNNNNNDTKYDELSKEQFIGADGSYQYFTNLKDNDSPKSFTSRIVNASTFLLPDSGQNVKRSANDTSSVDWQAGFSGNPQNLYTDPQNLTYVIERMWEERGGLDQNDLIKQSWNLYNEKHPEGPKNLKNNIQEPTCKKLKQPYPINAPFGLKFNQTSKHFDSIDVIAQAKSSPLFGQEAKLPFNYNAPDVNGGCNLISMIKNKDMCSNNDNNLTSTNNFNLKEDIPPLGI
jgi:hypothetical protein